MTGLLVVCCALVVPAWLGLQLAAPAPAAARPAALSPSHTPGVYGTVDAPRRSGNVVANVRIWNLTRYKLRFTTLQGEGQVDEAPAVGAVLPSGQFQTFRPVVYLFSEPRHFVNYELLNDAGTNVGRLTVKIKMHTPANPTWLGAPELSCLTADMTVPRDSAPECVPSRDWFVADNLTLQDPSGLPPVVYTPAQPVSQDETFRYLCARGSASCEFAATSAIHELSPSHPASGPIANPSDREMFEHVTVSLHWVYNRILSSEVSTDSAVVSNITAEIEKSFGHSWTVEHSFKDSTGIRVLPHSCAAVYTRDPQIRYGGDFTIKAGNTTWKLTGVHFDGADLTDQAKSRVPIPEVVDWPLPADRTCVAP